MGKLQKNQAGFSPVEALIIFIVVVVISFIGWYIWHTKQSTAKSLDAAAYMQAIVDEKIAQKKSTDPQSSNNTNTTTTPSTISKTSQTSTATSTTTQPQTTPATDTISEYYKISSDGTTATETPVTIKLKNVASVTNKLNLTCSGTCQFKLVSDDYPVADSTVYTGSQIISYTISTPGNHVLYNQYTPSTKFVIDF